MAVSFGLPGKNHGQTLSHKVVSSTPRLSRVRSYKNRNPDRKNSTRETKLKKKITFCRQIYGLCCCIRTTFWVCMMFLSCLCGFLTYRYLINIFHFTDCIPGCNMCYCIVWIFHTATKFCSSTQFTRL